jgi:hypothetical protein
VTPQAPAPGPEPADAPLTPNERALTLSLLVVGALIALFTVPTVGGAIYTLSTGKVMGSDLSKALMRAAPARRDEAMQELLDHQLTVQAEVQTRYAPYQLAAEGVYLAVWVAITVLAISLLRGRGGRGRLAQLALGGVAARLAVGVVTWLLTSELMRGSVDLMTAQTTRHTGQLGEGFNRGMQAAMTGTAAISAACMTFLVCGYLAVVAGVFLRVGRSGAPPSGSR